MSIVSEKRITQLTWSGMLIAFKRSKLLQGLDKSDQLCCLEEAFLGSAKGSKKTSQTRIDRDWGLSYSLDWWTRALLFFRTGLSTERVEYKVKIIAYRRERKEREANSRKSSLCFVFHIYLGIFNMHSLMGTKYLQRIHNLVWTRNMLLVWAWKISCVLLRKW